jgi:periplasmic divalent cation tolerance protein
MTAAPSPETVSIYVTVGNRDEARRLARILVAEQLAACVNVFDPVTSVFRWNEAIEEESETVLIAKASHSTVAQLKARLLELHPYDCPCIVVWPIIDGHEPYLQWVREECMR